MRELVELRILATPTRRSKKTYLLPLLLLAAAEPVINEAAANPLPTVLLIRRGNTLNPIRTP